MNQTLSHQPVMLKEVLENLAIKDHEIYVDGTFGAGGYSSAILQSANCRLMAFDRDHNVLKFVEAIKNNFNDKFIFKNKKFSQIIEGLHEENIEQIDGVVFDIGVSSMQLDEGFRGFSFDSGDKLDMRMDQSQKISAFEVINYESEQNLADIIYKFGDEIHAKKIAKKIVAIRQQNLITKCSDLANIVRSFYRGYYKTDPATKTFQAIRIFVNNELEELKIALQSSLKILKKGGRIVVVSFHSLEDKIVKDFFKEQAGLNQTYSRYQPEELIQKKLNKTLEIITKSAICPSLEEININPRARSAKMRVAIKL